MSSPNPHSKGNLIIEAESIEVPSAVNIMCDQSVAKLRVMLISGASGVAVEIRGLKLSGGYAEWGMSGGLRWLGSGSLLLDRCEISDNVSPWNYAGGIRFSGGVRFHGGRTYASARVPLRVCPLLLRTRCDVRLGPFALAGRPHHP